jgi:hypothetical protein
MRRGPYGVMRGYAMDRGLGLPMGSSVPFVVPVRGDRMRGRPQTAEKCRKCNEIEEALPCDHGEYRLMDYFVPLQ